MHLRPLLALALMVPRGTLGQITRTLKIEPE